ncbi:glycoside hydrolase family 95 protein-like protein [Paraphaeosphaeria sporulosa]|uniref:Glycoside hydrolase family 95 protein-like protein n=1 Tax=Paraphaeosphaeria sporulosa TaxID=1460663 RepID=A0A177CSW5_9PLEO|nr:glycoside hydrolase family 95 protein-like protein [Paraphaeosphaeria sporulosa]OAG09857.1 glycoside hydrolase family 95 protein-like protein [Paraphaeosphaeria sporulosa]
MFPLRHYSVILLATGPCTAKSLWSSLPATNYANVIREAYLLGNGKLGAMPFGSPGNEKIILNVDSLWSGGPFASTSYVGGNPSEEKYSYLAGIRDWIFQNTTGNVSQLLGSGDNYGSYQVMGNLSISYNTSIQQGSYRRELDLTTGLHATRFTDVKGVSFTSTVFCSFPDQICLYQLNANATLPQLSIELENKLLNDTLVQSSCVDGYAKLSGVTQVGPPEGMKFESVARIVGSSNLTRCEGREVIVPSTPGLRSLSIVVSAGTNYDQTKGNVANAFSFQGDDPVEYVQDVTAAAASLSPSALQKRHVNDYQQLSNSFVLELPDPNGSARIETATLLDGYNSAAGDPFVEGLLFDYSRHLLISSSRENSLPANLQGRWSPDLTAAWSGDYHANINLQMNYWAAEQTGLGEVQDGLWRYMQDTWVPRGTETAKLLYGAPGWVVHDEMNIFGHTGMKEEAQWANYPASAAWMMQHVTDHFSYSQNVTWLQQTGYPLLKGVTQFWLSQLQEDRFWNDGSLVVNPCNSPEHGPTTFGCAHYQQLLHQLFANMLILGPLAEEPDSAFISNISTTLTRLDKGFHKTSWDSVAEWKLPDPEAAEVYDVQNDTHRHLSHLWGWYPGLTLASRSGSFLGGYTNTSIQEAIETSLYSRGVGNGPDANAGWAKVWRSACWARLNNTERAYFELKYAIEQNFAGNALSMYSGTNPPFQIDANFGLAGAVLSMLVVDVEEVGMNGGGERTVVLGPAIPESWGGGSVKGLRLRGGGEVDFGWDESGLVKKVEGRAEGVEFVDRDGRVL